MRRSETGITAFVSIIVLAASLLCLPPFDATAQPTAKSRLMRFPDVHDQAVVFSYGGDLWLVSAGGGTARRITSHPGMETFPRFSPDGTRIAFTGQYNGEANVYVIPAEGGEPKQLTWAPDAEPMPDRFGPNNMVIEWYWDGKRILILSRRTTYNTWFGTLFAVSAEGGLPEPVPLPKGGLSSFSPDGERIAYNRIFRNFRTWKHYKGGMAQDIWIYDFAKKAVERITDYKGTDTSPMWHGSELYFTSDRGPHGRLNLYRHGLDAGKTERVTDFRDFDILWPSLGPGAIVFENGGRLFRLDLDTQKAVEIEVRLPGDRPEARPRWVDTDTMITGYSLSPDAERALLVARGDVYTVPAEEGNIRNITKSPGVREKDAAWSPDGRWIAYISDVTGEEEIFIAPGDGKGEAVRITRDGNCFRFPLSWSPDGKKLLFADKNQRLFFVDMDDRKPVLIDKAGPWEIRDYAWSPDSRWVAYAKPAPTFFYSIFLYSMESGKTYRVTGDSTDDSSPVFDPEGKYLYFLSKRSLNAEIGTFDLSYTYTKTQRIYVAALRSDLPSPFAPRSDEARIKEDEGSREKEAKEESQEEAEPFGIDMDGLEGRVVAVPMEPANIKALAAAKGKILYLTVPSEGLSGAIPGEAAALHLYDMEEREDHVLVSPVDGFALAADGEKLLYKEAESYRIIDAAPDGASGEEGPLDLSGMRAKIDPRAEWRQMFHEAWRLQRDYFYSPVMNGIDWEKARDLYAPLLEHLACRRDLTFVLGEMMGDLGNSHTYVGGGDLPGLEAPLIGVLGSDFALDPRSGRYRLEKIYKGENWDERARSPLTEPGLNVVEGDYLLAVDGAELRAPENPYSLFESTADRTVTLTVNSRPRMKGAREVVVKPVESEFQLRYLDMIETNCLRVDQASDGRVGYIYIPNMGGDGLNAFVKQYYPQIRKEGLIIDVRYNGGGFVDQMIFERLRRVLAGMDSSRNGADWTYPIQVFNGHLACVTNAYAASDGDLFTYYFKHYELGPVVGTRTWGGVRGIRGYTHLLDGGYITMPEFGFYDLESRWIMENHGVEPDMVVDNRPELVMQGRDPQLEKAVELVLKAIEEDPRQLPERPPYLPGFPDEAETEMPEVLKGPEE